MTDKHVFQCVKSPNVGRKKSIFHRKNSLKSVSIFMMIKWINSLKKEEATAPEAPAAPPKEQVLLEEIRDLLKK
jgi:hypothetical protein